MIIRLIFYSLNNITKITIQLIIRLNKKNCILIFLSKEYNIIYNLLQNLNR